MAGKDFVSVTDKPDAVNNLSVNVAGKKDCAFVTGIYTLPVHSCVVTHAPFAGGLLQKKAYIPTLFNIQK